MVTDTELLMGLNQDELEALADSKLVANTQSRLDNLLAQQKEKLLSTEENEMLDRLLAQVDRLTILKARARYTLHKQ